MNGNEQYVCEDCEWAGSDQELDAISDIHERVLVGELLAAGCCPECGSLIACSDGDVPDYTLEKCVGIARARGKLESAASEVAIDALRYVASFDGVMMSKEQFAVIAKRARAALPLAVAA